MEYKVYWYTQKEPKIIQLKETKKANVVIVGGGMMGLTCAENFRKNGAAVIILEKNFCGAGASGKTSGFITPDSELELSHLIKKYGLEQASKLWEFVLGGVKHIRDNILNYHIDCDYGVQDSLFIANSKRGTANVQRELEARNSLGYSSNFYDEITLGRVLNSQNYFTAVRYKDTFGINSYLYCQAMKEILIAQGVEIYENSPVAKINEGNVEVGNLRVFGDQIIVCGDRFIPDLGKLKDKIYHVQTFLMASKSLSDLDVVRIFKEDKLMVWDTDLVYQYFRMTGDNRLLLGGGDILYTYAKHEKLRPKRFFKKLTKYFKNHFPNINLDIEYIWPGMLGVTKDLLPIVSLDKKLKNVHYVGAATGLPWAAALGNYISEKIMKKRSDFDKYFSPDREFPINKNFLGKKVTFAISHGIVREII